VAASVSSPAPASAAKIPAGVPSLRAGQGRSFLWRRLHSLSGIFPIGAFLVEHYLSNAFATNSPAAYNDNVRFLTGLPFVIWLEITFIYIPLAYHAGYGFWIWWRGESNLAEYPWIGNWMYSLQRYTGIVAFFYMGYHTWSMRFSGAHIITHSQIAYAKVWAELQNPWIVAFYFAGLTCASFHFAYGLWLFAAKWGFIVGEQGRKRFGLVCLVIGLALTAMATGTVYAFVTTPQSQVPHMQEFLQLQHSSATYIPVLMNS
jgi:succinate dehydrogenase / fumarate reductase, cytochrome b subunit